MVHVRPMPHQSAAAAFDAVIVDSGAGIRATLARNPAIPQPETDAPAIGLAVRELVSGTGLRSAAPSRG